MKKSISRFLLAGLSFVISQLSFSPAGAQSPAFPGAEGVARWTTTGGRGGKIIHVTNLNDDGAGSLRQAVQRSSGARIVVFDVSGVINLRSALKISNDNITILGQTAPGDGICLRNFTFNISANNVIIRFIRCRMGDTRQTEDDAMNAYFKTGDEHSNIIIDHCTMSWCTDECGSFYGIKNFSLQWCVLSESLRNSVHDKGAHGYGGIWGGQNAAFTHNLLAHHDSRNPRFDHDYVNRLKGPIDYVNNVVYNWGGNSTYGGESANDNNEFRKINMLNNYYKPGPATANGVKSRLAYFWTECSNCTKATGCSTIVPAHIYADGNYMAGNSSVTSNNWGGITLQNGDKNTIKADSRFVPEGYEGQTILNLHSAEEAFSKVLAYAGASYKKDVIDQRIAREAQEGSFTYYGSNGSTGGLIDTQGDVGAWPEYVSKTPLADTDQDGMPDVWETANGLNPNDADDAKAYTLDAKGFYTNIEVYANSIVEGLVKAQTADAAESISEYYPVCQKAEGITYYDPAVTAEGGYGESDGAQGTIAWPLNNNTDAEVGSTLKEYFESATMEIGSNFEPLSYGTYGDIRFARFKVITPHVEAPADDDAISMAISTKSGNSFQATNIQLTACKVGTDNGYFNATWTDANGTRTIITAAEPKRNNADNGYHSTYNLDVSTLTTATDGTCRLTLYPYNVGFYKDGVATQKEMGFANVIIKGIVTDPAGISATATVGTPLSTVSYNAAGQRVSGQTRGLVITHQRMPDGTTRITKAIR